MDREHQTRHAEDHWISSTSPQAQAAGRSTLSEGSDGAAGGRAYTQRSLFASIAAPEPEPALPSAEAPHTETLAAPAPAEELEDEHAAPPPADAAAVTHGDDPAAKERIYGDQHHDPHGGPFEHRKAHAEQHPVKRDQFNKASIKSDKIGRDVAARPGVILEHGGHRDGVFMLKHAQATRYTFVRHGGTMVAQPYDVIEKKDLAHHNYKNSGHASGAGGNTKRLLLNPAHPRKLTINGQERVCVLSWIDGMTAAWIPVGELEGSFGAIVAAATQRARKWDPARVSNDPDAIAKKSQRYVVRNDKVGQTTPGDEPHGKARVLEAGAHGGDNVSHYLSKDIRKPAFDDKGERIAGKNVTRSVAAICMNLPSSDAPPVAIDTAEAGQSFFVMRDKSFHREVPVFENGAHKSNLVQTWVFGHLAMRDGNGKLVPDPSRRGWVPLRILAEAAHLETKDIEQRT